MDTIPISPAPSLGHRAIPLMTSVDSRGKSVADGIPLLLLTCREGGCFMHRLAIFTSKCRPRCVRIHVNQMSIENGWRKASAVNPTAGIISKFGRYYNVINAERGQAG